MMKDYEVKVGFDDGWGWRKTTHSFQAQDDKAAKAYLKENEGKDLNLVARGVSFDRSTLRRVTPV